MENFVLMVISLAAPCIRATETGLVDRFRLMVAGTRVAANRIKVSVMEEERDRAKAAAHFQAHVRGRGAPCMEMRGKKDIFVFFI